VDTLDWNPGVAPDGRIFYVARKGDQEYVVLGDQSGPLFRKVGGIGFSPDGKSMIYVVRLSDDPNTPGDHLVVDGKVGEEAYGYIQSFAISPDGKAVALKTHSKSGVQVVVGRQRSEGYQFVYDFNFSPDSRKLAFCARRGREVWWKVMDLN